jgi:hypothetical protein
MSISESESDEEIGVTELGKQLADEFEANNLKQTTRRRYESNLNVLRKYLKANYPETVLSNNEILFPLSEEIIHSFLGFSSYSDPKNREKIRSPGTLSGYVSAIKYGYSLRNLPFPTQLSLTLKRTINGFTRKYSLEKEKGNVKIIEGKRPLSEMGYIAISKFALKYSNGETQFAHPYSVILWTLMCRTSTVATIIYDHIYWEGDSLRIFISRHKGDQEGIHAYPRNLYANPFQPEVCPVLALALHMFSSRFVRSSSVESNTNSIKLFPGAHNEKNFSAFLQKKVCSHLSEIDIGIPAHDLGPHSYRKGVSTYSMKFPGGPSSMALHMRGGWKLPGNLGRYVYEGDGADQFIGRTVSLLDLTDSERFSILPPHFHESEVHLSASSNSTIDWNALICGYDRCTTGLKSAFKLMLASLAYHVDWIAQNVSENHPVLTSRVWTSGILPQLKAKVHLCSRICSGCGMMASGTPIQWSQAKILNRIENNLQVFEQRTDYQLKSIMIEAQATPQNVATKILNNFSVNGAIPVTIDQVGSLLQSSNSQLVRQLEERVLSMVEPLNNVALSDSSNNNNGDIPPEVFQDESDVIAIWYLSWHWGGKLHHPIPMDYDMPRGNNLMLWNLWLFGIRSEGIRPFRRIHSFSFNKERSKNLFVKASQVMKELINIAVEDIFTGGTPKDVYQISESESGRIFSKCYESLLSRLETGYREVHRDATVGVTFFISERRKVETIKYITTYNDIRKYIQKKRW